MVRTPSIERLTATTAKDAVEARMAEVCAFADELFEGTAARFAFVVWPEGFHTEEGAVAIAAQPQAQSSAATALLTAHRALAKQGASA